jgi:hypothetical protein
MKFCLSIFLVSLFLLSCSNKQTAGSTNVESGGIMGKVQHLDGSPAAGTDVWLYKSDFENLDQIQNAPEVYLYKQTATAEGSYSFDDLDTGFYNVEAYHSGAKTRLFKASVSVEPGSVQELTPQTLHTPGYVTIRVDSANSIPGYFYIPGSSRVIELQASQQVVHMDSIPAGATFGLYFQKAQSEYQPLKIADSLIVEPGDTLFLTH